MFSGEIAVEKIARSRGQVLVSFVLEHAIVKYRARTNWTRGEGLSRISRDYVGEQKTEAIISIASPAGYHLIIITHRGISVSFGREARR